MSVLEWIDLDPTISATSASGKLCHQLAQRGDEPINMGQGNEIEVPPEDIRPHWQGQSGPAYNIDVGGPKASKEAMARMLHDFYGIPADGDNTFVLQSNGRSGLLNLLGVVTRRADVANSSHRPVVYMEELHWPMYQEIVETAGQVRIMNAWRTERFMSAILNDPNNPTGKMMTEGEHRALRQTDKELYGAKVQHHRFYDGPYMYAGKPNEDGPNYIGPNYGSFITHDDPNHKPWAIVVSFSKSDAMANPGLCALVVHPSLKKDLQTVLLANNGISYDLGLMGALPQAFGEANDKARLEHYGRLRSKYMTNRGLMEKLNFPLVPGDPCMTAVADVSDLLGRRLTADQFGVREVKTVTDLVAVLGNVAGVVTVAQNERLLRFALSAHPDKFSVGIHKTQTLLNNLLHAPKL